MKRVLVTPLDWGLGHATRCIPVIRELLSRKCEVLIAGHGDSLALLKAEFPGLRFFTLPGYCPAYPVAGKSMVLKMASQLPKFLNTIRKEHRVIEHLVREHEISCIISDNRYGCWSAAVPSVFITHQSNILMPKRFGWLSGWVRSRNEALMKRFTRCWIPDYPESHSLAGELISFGTRKSNIPFVYVGVLSRFKPAGNSQKKYDITAIFSGPEPQRTMVENKVLPQLQRSGLTYCVVRGAPSLEPLNDQNCINFLTTQALEQIIKSTTLVIARSGYSTLMDMAALEKKVIFVPTPGQTEQEYLAKRMKEKGIAFFMEQEKFNLEYARAESMKFSGFSRFSSDKDLLNYAIDELMEMKIG